MIGYKLNRLDNVESGRLREKGEFSSQIMLASKFEAYP